MESLPAILFPHACLPEADIKKVLSFFGPLTLFQPWFMEPPPFLEQMEERNVLRVMCPPEDLNPGQGFKTLMHEYRDWSTYHQDRGYTEFLKVTRAEESRRESTWTIRGRLRKGEQEVPAHREAQALKWHFLLHLAREIDDQRQEADDLLASLKRSGSPLAGSIEEPLNPLADLPQFREGPPLPGYPVAQVVEAWIGLFGGHLNHPKKEALLVTRNPQVLEYVQERREEQGMHGLESPPVSIHFSWPDLSHKDLDDLFGTRDEILKGRAITRFGEALGRLGQGDIGKDREKDMELLAVLSGDMEKGLSWDASWGRLKITVTAPGPAPEGEQGDQVLWHLSGKRLILVEDGSP